MDQFVAFLNDPAGLAVKGALVAAFLDFAVGTALAIARGTFVPDQVAAFLRKHVLGRVVPLSMLAFAGYFTGDVAMNAAAAAGLVAYAAETIASIWTSLNESKAEAAATTPTD